MNLLLLERHELDDAGRAEIEGRRAAHLLDVLGAAPGRRLRCGVLDGPLGTAEVVAINGQAVELRCEFETEVPDRPADTLLLGLPRPRVLGRILEDATAIGFGRIVVLRSWRTDKSHVRSRVLEPARIERHLRSGLEQGARTRKPRVEVHDRFKPWVEDHLHAELPARRWVADPNAIAPPTQSARPVAIAIGPERGWTPYETGMLVERDFVPALLAGGVLRVETAVAIAWARCKPV